MKRLVLFFAILIPLFGFACGQPQAEQATPEPQLPVSREGTLAPKAGWEQKWQTVLADAKKEGTVSIYSLWVPGLKNALSKAFKDKYGIELEFTAFSRGADFAAKSAAEYRAGLHLADIYGPGNPTLILNMKPEGILAAVEPSLILPEVLDSKVWVGGKLPFADNGGYSLSMIGYVQKPVMENSDLIKDGEITSYKDLLKPQYKGKMVLNDPSIAGGSNALFSHLGGNLWGDAEATDYLRKLVKDQQVMVQRDNRLHVEWLARGKYSIGIAPLREIMTEFVAVGAPLKIVDGLKEDNRLSASTGTLGLAAKPAHPNAMVLFANWILTKEGQSIFATNFGSPSTRLDASTQGIDPDVIPVPGQSYYGESEEAMAARDRWLVIAQKVIAESTK